MTASAAKILVGWKGDAHQKDLSCGETNDMLVTRDGRNRT